MDPHRLMAATGRGDCGLAGIGAPKKATEPQLAHMVYFKLKDGSGGNARQADRFLQALAVGPRARAILDRLPGRRSEQRVQ